MNIESQNQKMQQENPLVPPDNVGSLNSRDGRLPSVSVMVYEIGCDADRGNKTAEILMKDRPSASFLQTCLVVIPIEKLSHE